ncbi:MAG: porin [Flavobacteriales bacterium]
MQKISTIIISVVLVSFSSFAQQKVDGEFGKGINIITADSSFSMNFSARFQSLYMVDGIINNDNQISDGTSQFLIRRSRLKFGGHAYSPKVKYKIELGLSNRDISGAVSETKDADRIILDAVLKYNFYKGFSIWGGQTKLPGNRERVISSGNLQFVDRSLVNSKYTLDRDMGIQLRHKHKIGKMVLREAFSLSQGEGRNITALNIGGLDYTSRLEILPFGTFAGKGDYVGSDTKRESSPKLAIGVTYDFHDRAARQRGQQGSFIENTSGEYVTSSLKTVFIDLMFKYKGISVMAEYADKNGDNSQALDSDGISQGYFYTGTGLNLQAGYLFKSNWELAGRYTNIQPETTTGKTDIDQFTFGTSKYIVGHKLKVQSDLSYTTEEGKDDKVMMRLQFDIHF